MPDTSVHAGFARNFQVPNFQGISAGTAKLDGTSGGTGLPVSTTLDAETDYTWDVGYTHRFTPHLQWAQDSYFRIDRNYIDEGEFGFVPLDAPFNYVRGYGAGIKNTLTYNTRNFGLRATAFVAREEDRGVETGQYNFPPFAQLQYIDNHYIILDHSPLLGISGGTAYRWHDYRFTIDGLCSSGLRSGFAKGRYPFQERILKASSTRNQVSVRGASRSGKWSETVLASCFHERLNEWRTAIRIESGLSC